jgi:DNA-binding LytR/AlgR family response regulator
MNSPYRILIVEDNFLTASSLKAGLESAAFVVCGVASNYKDAVKLIRSEKPDLLLVDIELGPGNADGIAVAKEMKRLRAAPIVFLTGMVDPKVFEEAREASPVAFLHKPFRSEEVKRQVQLALHNYYGENREGVMGAESALYIPDGQDKVRINLDEVVYVEADGSYTKIFLARDLRSGLETSERLVAVNLANVKVHFSSNFLDVSRSLTINLHFLDRIGTRSLQLGPYEVEIPAGKAKMIMESVKLARSEKKKGRKWG